MGNNITHEAACLTFSTPSLLPCRLVAAIWHTRRPGSLHTSHGPAHRSRLHKKLGPETSSACGACSRSSTGNVRDTLLCAGSSIRRVRRFRSLGLIVWRWWSSRRGWRGGYAYYRDRCVGNKEELPNNKIYVSVRKKISIGNLL